MRDQICSTPNFMFFTQQVCLAKTKIRILTIPWHSHPFALWRHSRNTLKLNSYISYVGRSRWKTLFPIVRVRATASRRTQALPPLGPPHPSSDSAQLLRSNLLPATEQDWLQKTLSPRALWAPYSWTPTLPLPPGQMPTVKSQRPQMRTITRINCLCINKTGRRKHSLLASLPLATQIIYHNHPHQHRGEGWAWSH